MSIRRGLLLLRTLPTLRWEQLWYRPVRRLQAALPVASGPDVSVAPERAAAMAEERAGWLPEPGYLERADEVLAGTFRFLNHPVRMDEIDWTDRPVSALWSYNLHYFDYALDLALAFRSTGRGAYLDRLAELLVGWARGSRPDRGDGWAPYVLSVRIVNWIHVLLLVGDDLDPSTRSTLQRSLAAQLHRLERRLEWHILGNHLARNLVALVIGGLYFEGRGAERWTRRGQRLLWDQVAEQVLGDGVHFERSPMYHALVLGDLLEVLALLGAVGRTAPPNVLGAVASMVDALGVLSRPDGSLHRFNDSADGVAPPREHLDRLARRVVGRGVPAPRGSVSLPEAGYYGLLDEAAGTRLLVDAGPPGPVYQPGHAHCDLLSYELDLAGRPLVVDSGVCGYEGDPLREYVRSTRAHNTVMIAGREQSEIWDTFRMARRAEVLSAAISHAEGRFAFAGSYRPFHDRRCAHERRIEGEGGRWRVTDRVRGARGAPVDGFVHLHPQWRIERAGDAFVARSGPAGVAIEPFGADGVQVRSGEEHPPQGWFCPAFGRGVEAPVLQLTLAENDEREFGYLVRSLPG